MNESTGTMMLMRLMLIFNVILILMGTRLTYAINLNGICPRILPKVFDGYAPIGN